MRTPTLHPAYALLLALALTARTAPAQLPGTYTMRNPQGATVTLTFVADGASKVKGTLAGNGISFELQGDMQNDAAAGTMRGAQGGGVFEARRQGTQLLLLLAELGADGQPNPATLRQVLFTFDPTAAPAKAQPAPAAASTGAAAGAAATDSARAAPGAAAPSTAADQQLSALLVSTAWCSFSFSGNSGYSSSGKTRVVFSPDGTVRQTSGSESVSSGYGGTAFGGSSNAVGARWRLSNGQLAVSGDGVNWKPVRLEMTYNNLGAPIPKLDGVEHMRCQ